MLFVLIRIACSSLKLECTILMLKTSRDFFFFFFYVQVYFITKTCLFKYIENFTTNKGNFSDKKF